ncbi:MAG: hypothetical protein JSW71_20090, partial [Gemmatimonadota bacterium]
VSPQQLSKDGVARGIYGPRMPATIPAAQSPIERRVGKGRRPLTGVYSGCPDLKITKLGDGRWRCAT